MLDKYAIFKETDEIDHVTIIYTRGGKLDINKSIGFIKRHYACDTDVKNALINYDLSDEKLFHMKEQELYELLVIIRETLLRKIWNE